MVRLARVAVSGLAAGIVLSAGACSSVGRDAPPSGLSAWHTFRTATYSVSVPTGWTPSYRQHILTLNGPHGTGEVVCAAARPAPKQTVADFLAQSEALLLTPHPGAAVQEVSRQRVNVNGVPGLRVEVESQSTVPKRRTHGTELFLQNANWILLVSVFVPAQDSAGFAPTLSHIVSSLRCVPHVPEK